MQKIGVLGGTFDPIHYGHLFIAENAMQVFALDKVMFIPTGIPPHKVMINVTDKQHRFNMVSLAVKSNTCFEVSNIEVAKDTISYTIDTMTELKKLYPNDLFYYIVGADSLYDMASWKNFRKLAKLFEIISINRMTGKFLDVAEISKSITEKYGFVIHTLEVPILEISSTEIRRRVQEGLPIKYMLPDNVERYIRKHKLYK
ncbi:MAG: Nicotinate-nucleotide adenylyltransferase [Firmicutes bacterium ADurb.Bin193]|nr:MAG: Nicotinate-nucleotide adenylyltransferase [Firmicutes bacterium ADurb.Bin193]